MENHLSVASRRDLIQAISQRYRAGTKPEKHLILDEFIAVSGYHRKHAIRLLRLKVDKPAIIPRLRPRRYGTAVSEALLILWESSDRICSKRLKPLIPILLASLERHGHMTLPDDVRTSLLAAMVFT